jgi:hypothetical protein
MPARIRSAPAPAPATAEGGFCNGVDLYVAFEVPQYMQRTQARGKTFQLRLWSRHGGLFVVDPAISWDMCALLGTALKGNRNHRNYVLRST